MALTQRNDCVATEHKIRQGGREEPPVVSGGRASMLDFVQQLVSGVALGCVYGLIALGFVLVYDKLAVIAATMILCTRLWLFFNKTTLGTAMRASSENMLAAYYMGIPVKRVVSIVWAISAAVATCAGVLLAPITFIHSNVGLVLGLKAFPAAVLGGFGSIPGAENEGVLFGVIESMAGFYLAQGWKDKTPNDKHKNKQLLIPEGLFGLHM